MGNSKECVTALLGGARLRAVELVIGLRASIVEARARDASVRRRREGHGKAMRWAMTAQCYSS